MHVPTRPQKSGTYFLVDYFGVIAFLLLKGHSDGNGEVFLHSGLRRWFDSCREEMWSWKISHGLVSDTCSPVSEQWLALTYESSKS